MHYDKERDEKRETDKEIQEKKKEMNKRKREKQEEEEKKNGQEQKEKKRIERIINSLTSETLLKDFVSKIHSENLQLYHCLIQQQERIDNSNIWLCKECDTYVSYDDIEECRWCDKKMCDGCHEDHDCRIPECYICKQSLNERNRGNCDQCNSENNYNTLLCSSCTVICESCNIEFCKGCIDQHLLCIKCGECGKRQKWEQNRCCHLCKKRFCKEVCSVKCTCSVCDPEKDYNFEYYCKTCFNIHQKN